MSSTAIRLPPPCLARSSRKEKPPRGSDELERQLAELGFDADDDILGNSLRGMEETARKFGEMAAEDERWRNATWWQRLFNYVPKP